MMKAEYTDATFLQNRIEPGTFKRVSLPFKRLSARALILRKRDGAILGTLHRPDGQYALPGGAMEDGESTAEAVARELAEENIKLIGCDGRWRERFSTDYYPGYFELSVWHIFIVEEAEIGECDENIESRWIGQQEDVWYPNLREKALIALQRHAPQYLKMAFLIQ